MLHRMDMDLQPRLSMVPCKTISSDLSRVCAEHRKHADRHHATQVAKTIVSCMRACLCMLGGGGGGGPSRANMWVLDG